MQTIDISIDRDEARRLYRRYKTHRHYDRPMDDEIRRAYQLLAQGRLVVQALASIKAAGVDEAGLPKLAIARADAEGALCDLRLEYDGGGYMTTTDYWYPQQRCRRTIRFAANTFPQRRIYLEKRALVPVIPADIRPRRAIENYHILWEAEWEKVPPRDPYLLRRIGKADLWLVVGMWDLTEVERAVMAGRIATA